LNHPQREEISPVEPQTLDKETMASPVIEICYLTLKPNADVNTPGSTAAKTWNDIVTTVSLQEGYQRSRWGTQIENPNVLMMMIGSLTPPCNQGLVQNAN
jgi:hypothetical protein